MDQLKEQLIKIKPFAFWIACGVILVGSLATWYMATGALNAQHAEQLQKIKTAFTSLQGIQPKLANHPNLATQEQMGKLTQAYGEEIAKGWELQYKKQEEVLVWPASFDQDFQDAVKDLRPIEKVPVKADIKLTIPDSLRRRYRDFIEDELPKLATTIGGRWYANRDETALQPTQPALGPNGQPIVEVDRSMVLWSPENQKEILLGHFGFTAREDDPTTLDVLYAQEDLWVIQNIMGIIKRTNDTAEGRHDAAVKQIEYLRLGKTALGTAGQVMVVGPASTTPGGGMPGYGEGMPMAPQPTAPQAGQPTTGTPMAGSPPVNPTTSTSFNVADPGNWRYVDKNNVPLAGYQLREAIAPPAPGAMTMTQTNPAETALLTVAKRMPIRIRLEIDQRKLNKLLTEFGNAPLPVEVRQLRINREPAPLGSPESFFAGIGAMGGGGAMPGATGGGAMPGATGGGVREGGGGYPAPGAMPGPRYGEGMPGGGTGTPLAVTRDATLDTNLIKLELYGIVYLYNPVNRTVLGLPPVAGAATAMTTPAVDKASGG